MGEERKLICPVCGGDMKTKFRYGVEIDVCKKCKGVWLDRGELNKIIQTVSEIYNGIGEIQQENKETEYLNKIFEIDNI